MDSKQLCLSLIKAESEEEVIQILSTAGYWDDDSAWAYYGANSMNFSQVGNQQSRPEQALVEKLINSVDAMLMRECLLRGLNPEDHANVPGSIRTEESLRSFLKRSGRHKELTLIIHLELPTRFMHVSRNSKRAGTGPQAFRSQHI